MIRAKLPPQIEWQEIRRAKRRPASAFAGMTYLLGTYRHGEKRKVGLPPLKSEASVSKRPLRGEKRKRVVDEVVKILRHWSSSPFEREGSTLAGLRSGLVLDGNRWAVADFEAAEIVAEGLRIIRAKRPSWEEGQARYVDRGDFCVRCGKPMPDDLVTGGRNQRFCSSICAEAELEQRDTVILARQSSARAQAERMVAREKIEAKACSQCGETFRALNPYRQGGQVYCSQACYHSARVKNPELECLACGKHFRSKMTGRGKLQQFCSAACSDGYGRTTAYSHTCQCCGKLFISTRPDSKFCSRRCLRFVSDWRNEIRIPSKFSDLLFDYLFTAPAALARAEGVTQAKGVPAELERPEHMFLTVGIFDRLCTAA